jgi:hypothetical protein
MRVGKQGADLPIFRRAREAGDTHHLDDRARKADTNGPTGVIKCGNTWANIFKKLPSAFRDARTGPVDSLNPA